MTAGPVSLAAGYDDAIHQATVAVTDWRRAGLDALAECANTSRTLRARCTTTRSSVHV